jgi:O-antigen/teichoic acid export membrane protein
METHKTMELRKSLPDSTSKLKEKIQKGGFYLALRQGITTILSLVSVFFVARIIGPKNYGIFSISVSYFYFATWISKLGLTTFIVRHPSLPKNGAQIALFLSVIIGFISCLVAWSFAPLLGSWTGQAEVEFAFRCLVPAIFIDNIGRVSLAMLERNLQFAEAGIIEAISQVSNYCITIPLVLMGWSYKGPITGVFTQYFLLSLLSIRYFPISFKFIFSWRITKEALSYGVTYTIADFILSLKRLVVPTLISRMINIEAVGAVSIAARFAEQLTVFRNIINRMSISVMAKILDKSESIKKALSDGMAYQMLLMAPVCAVFSCVSSWIVPIIFGEGWILSVKIFPFIAIGVIVPASFQLHISTLFAEGSNIEVIKLNLVYVSILWITSYIFLNFIGAFGYAISILVSLPSFWIVHRSFSVKFGRPSYKNAVNICIATFPALLIGPFIPPYWSLLLLIVSLISIFVLNKELKKMTKEILLIAKAYKGKR